MKTNLMMNDKRFTTATAVLVLLAVFGAGMTVGARMLPPLASAVVSESEATRDDADWGTLFSYYEGETFGTENALAAVAEIKPGMEIHPPHRHTEEEIMLVTEGQGTWYLNGQAFEANVGDMLYASPWDVHGITNTGAEPLRFVVWKWDNKGIARPADPQE